MGAITQEQKIKTPCNKIKEINNLRISVSKPDGTDLHRRG